MKKVLLLLFTVLLSVVSCKKDNPFEGLGNPISKQKAMSIMKSTIDNSEDVGMYKVIIPADEPFDYNGYGAPGSATAPSYDSWLFLINTFWNTNDQRYIDYYFVNAKTGEIEHRQYGGPPVMNGVSTAFSRDNYECIKNPYGQLLTKSAGTDSIMQSVNPDPDSFYINSYAVIICGGINEYWNYFRYWMDCQFLYKTLKNYYGFTDSNIITLVCGGPSCNWIRG